MALTEEDKRFIEEIWNKYFSMDEVAPKYLDFMGEQLITDSEMLAKVIKFINLRDKEDFKDADQGYTLQFIKNFLHQKGFM